MRVTMPLKGCLSFAEVINTSSNTRWSTPSHTFRSFAVDRHSLHSKRTACNRYKIAGVLLQMSTSFSSNARPSNWRRTPLLHESRESWAHLQFAPSTYRWFCTPANGCACIEIGPRPRMSSRKSRLACTTHRRIACTFCRGKCCKDEAHDRGTAPEGTLAMWPGPRQ